MELRKAEKKKVKLKIGISGASGFGKTYSALLLAYGITGDWSKIAVIDTENDSASLYSDLGEYNVLTLGAPFTPERYIEAINTCVNAGMECLVIDSITHEWDGKGGCLEIAEQITQASAAKNSYTAWAKVTPRHNDFVQTILQSPVHTITTTRRKQDYDMVKNDKGRTEVVKVGTKEITRDGYEYELTLNFEITTDYHYVKASKDRTGLFMNQPEFVITTETGRTLINWANSGIDLEKVAREKEEFELQNDILKIQESTSLDELKEVFLNSKFKNNHLFFEAKEIKKQLLTT